MAERAVDCYVAALPDGQREIAEAVRRLVRSVAPEAREAFKWAQLQDQLSQRLAARLAGLRVTDRGVTEGVTADPAADA
jgi:hypothetical protein